MCRAAAKESVNMKAVSDKGRSQDASVSDGVEISLEFFPPRSAESALRLEECAKRLSVLQPRYASVTYGAGGSTQDKTLETVQRVERSSGIPGAVHLTCVGASRDQVDAIARGFKTAGVKHIVALRGDPPEGHERYSPHPGGYAYAADLVAGLRRVANFEISVAAYPETHPEAASAAADLDNLKRKLDAGASQAITQFFFDSDAYLRFLARARAAGIQAPIVPGILPIGNFNGMLGFAARCGARVPAWLHRRFEGREKGGPDAQQIAVEVAAEQCRYLQRNGVKEFHFYTLNRDDLTLRICEQLDGSVACASSAHRAMAAQVPAEGLRA
jgi:methylenetetrahydrofolate reductase (NADPH)